MDLLRVMASLRSPGYGQPANLTRPLEVALGALHYALEAALRPREGAAFWQSV